MSKVRINDLARELEVKSKAILDVLKEVGVTDPKTHSSSLEADEAQRVRSHFQRGSSRNGGSAAKAESGAAPKIDWSRVSKPGDVLKAIQQRKEEAERPAPRPQAAPPAPVAKTEAAPQKPAASTPPPAAAAAAPPATVPKPEAPPRRVVMPQPRQAPPIVTAPPPPPPAIAAKPPAGPVVARPPVTAAPRCIRPRATAPGDCLCASGEPGGGSPARCCCGCRHQRPQRLRRRLRHWHPRLHRHPRRLRRRRRLRKSLP